MHYQLRSHGGFRFRLLLPKSSVVFLILLCSITTAFAQHDYRKGYYITLDNDSITGLIDYQTAKSASRICYYKNADKFKKSFRPGEIKAYGFQNGKRYVSKVHPTERRTFFFEHIVDGKMGLYRIQATYYVETDSMYVLARQKEVDISNEKGTHKIIRKPYKGILNYLLFSCKLSGDNVPYNEFALTSLVQNYNRCKGSPGVVYATEEPMTKLTVAAVSGIGISHLVVEDTPGELSFQNSITPVFGAGLDFSAPRYFDRFFASLEALYSKQFHQGYEEYTNPQGTHRNDYFIDISYIKVPFSLRYNFLSEQRTPYIKAGVAKYFKLESRARILSERENNGIVVTEEEQTKLDNVPSIGLWVGAGFQQTIHNRLKGFLELRIEKSSAFENRLTSKSHATDLYILLGLRF